MCHRILSVGSGRNYISSCYIELQQALTANVDLARSSLIIDVALQAGLISVAAMCHADNKISVLLGS